MPRNIVIFTTLALVLLTGGAAFAQSFTANPDSEVFMTYDQGTAVEAVSYSFTAVDDPMGEASEMMQMAQEKCSKISHDKKEGAPACVAYEKMLAAYWSSMTTQHNNMLTVAEDETLAHAFNSSIGVSLAQTAANNTSGSRDLAKINDLIAAGTQGNLLAVVSADGVLATANANNTLATVEASGALATENAANVLEAAQAIDPTTDVVDVPALSEQIRNLSAAVDEVWLSTEEWISFQRSQCESNANLSWCN